MRWLDRVVEHPRVHNLIQDLAGRRAVHEHIFPWLEALSGPVLDVGGGTGRIVALLSSSVQYINVDPDARRRPDVVARGEQLPFPSHTMHGALMVGMAHHLSDDGLAQVLDEVQRVLTPGGTVILLEPVLSSRAVSRLLWSHDRGACARRWEALSRVFEARFIVDDWLRFEHLHAYLALRCRSYGHLIHI